jgi:hypothetical protein
MNDILVRIKRAVLARSFRFSKTVPDLEFHKCPDCGEQPYDQEAMRKFEQYSPAYAKRRKKKAA